MILVDAAALGAERQGRLKSLRALAAAAGEAVVVVMTPEVGEDEAGRLLGAGSAQIVRKPIAAPALAEELRAGFEIRAAVAKPPAKARASAV